MSTDLSVLRRLSQEFVVTFDLYQPRNWQVSDVDYRGYDDPAVHPYPPPDDPAIRQAATPFWQGVAAIGDISGSVSGGGWSCTLEVPQVGPGLDDLPEFGGVDLMIQTWHGGVPGVVGAAGIDAGRVRLFRGYLRRRSFDEDTESGDVRYEVRNGIRFLQDSATSRAIDWYDGHPDHGPTTTTGMLNHIIERHTNWHPRSEHSIWLPDQSFDEFTMGAGSIYNLLKSVADNEVIEGWVYTGRDDQLVISGHPNMVGEGYGNGASDLNTPIIEYDDSIVEKWHIPELTRREVASVTITAQTSDQQELTAIYYYPGGLGSNVPSPVTFRSDDINHVNMLAERYAHHLNRQYIGVQLDLPLNVAVNTGDIVLCTHRGRSSRVRWYRKPFVVTDISYAIDLDKGGFGSTVTLDEITL